MEKTKWVGQSIRRKEDQRFITGTGLYVDDVKLPGMTYATFVRSPHAHAKIKGIEVRDALGLPGVLTVLTGSELAKRARPMPAALKLKGMKPCDYPALAIEKVRFVGDPVAAVVAEDRGILEDAVELVQVDYETLPSVVDMEKALEKDSPLLYEDWGTNVIFHEKIPFGEKVDTLFQEADLVVQERIRSHRHTGTPIECRGCVAVYDKTLGTLKLWTSTQHPHIVRTVLADTLGMAEHLITVIAPDVGGAFGIKSHIFPEEVVIPVLAMETGRPVKWIEERREHLLACVHAREQTHDIAIGFRKDGTMIAIRDRILSDMGAYGLVPQTGVAPTMLAAAMVPGGYKVRGYEVDVNCIMTNKCPYGAYRGFGQPKSNMARERLIDIAAEKLGIDRIEIRKKNLIKKSEFPYRQVTGTVLDPGSYIESLEKAAAMMDVGKWEEEKTKRRAQGSYVGIGMCVMSEASTPNSYFLRRQGIHYMRGYESASVTIDPVGKVQVAVGVSPQGQSHETIFAQIVADELGVGVDDVTVIHGDTSLTPYGFGTFGSRSTGAAGSAALIAARQVKEKTLRIAAAMLEAQESDLELAEGKVQVRGVPQKALSLRDVSRAAYMDANFLVPGLEPGLSATRSFEGENMPFPNSTHMVALEVEAATGEIKILKYVIVEDCGVVINPKSVEGQIHGATAHAIGGSLYEELIYDENGQLLTSTLMDYLVPTAMEIPEMEVGHLVTPTPVNPLGAKAAGEAGTSACPAALMNAVADALKPLGVKVTDMPLTPARLWAMIDAAQKARAA